MYDFIAGDLVSKSPTCVVIETGGVGYRLRVPLSTYEKLPEKGRVRLHTYLHVRDDSLQLYGFATEVERAAFEKLLSVRGVGPGLATMILSGLPVRELCTAVAQGDVATLTRIKGIGRKTAERIVVDLRDAMAGVLVGTEAVPVLPDTARDAVAALLSLGYVRAAAERAVQAALRKLAADAPVEQIVREALRQG